MTIIDWLLVVMIAALVAGIVTLVYVLNNPVK